MALHGYVNTTKITAWDVDAYNLAGIYPNGDIDNGTFVTLKNINKVVGGTNPDEIKGYEYIVEPATKTSTHVWLVATPEVGSTIDQQLMADPRLFYNEQGKPLSLKFMNPYVDCIEVTPEAFSDGQLPTSTNKYITLDANGKLKATNTDPSTSTGTYFTFEGYHNTTFGMKEEKCAVIRCVRN